MFTPLLIGALLVAVGIGNIWVARGKTTYYESAYWKSTNQNPAKGPSRLVLRELPTQVSESDSLAARRAFSRVVFYGMVARCGYILMVIGFGAGLITALQITKERRISVQNLSTAQNL